jgi:hypothetical protein
MCAAPVRPLHTFASLKAKQRLIRDTFPENLSLRVHRGLSWLDRAEREVEAGDYDAACIFYWIGFNALYAEDSQDPSHTIERDTFSRYFLRVLALDNTHAVHRLMWETFYEPIRALLSNRFVFQPYWKHHNGVSLGGDWRSHFNQSQSTAMNSFAQGDTRAVLNTVFDRLYVLRNQLVHGGATWNSSVNRAQVRDGVTIMSFLVPMFVNLMMDHPENPWGAAHYPLLYAASTPARVLLCYM